MEVIKDFFSGLKERLSSPFFISLFILLVAYNYRIVIPLLFYKHEDLWLDNHWTYLDLIQHLKETHNIYYVKPLLTSIAFSILFPVFNAISEFFQQFIVTWKDKLYYKYLAKVEAISVAQHKELSDKLKLDQAKYADEIRTRDARIADKERLEAEGQTLKDRITKMEDSQKLFADQLDAEHTSYMKAQERSEQLFTELALSNSVNDRLKSKISNKETEITQMQNNHLHEINLFREEKNNALANLQELETRYERELSEKTSEASSFLENLTQARADVDYWKAERDALLASKSELENLNQERLNVIKNWHEELNKLSMDIGPLDASVVSREGRMATLPSAKLSQFIQYIDKVQTELPGVATYHP